MVLVGLREAEDVALAGAGVAFHGHILRGAVMLGAQSTAARASRLERKYHAQFIRLRDGRDHFPRFVIDPVVPFDTTGSERTIRMPNEGSRSPAAGVPRPAPNTSPRSEATSPPIPGKAPTPSTPSSTPPPATRGSRPQPEPPPPAPIPLLDGSLSHFHPG
jgi:hypothetical protein